MKEKILIFDVYQINSMRFSTLSLISILLIVISKTITITEEDYHRTRIFAGIIPKETPFVPSYLLLADEKDKVKRIISNLKKWNNFDEFIYNLSDSLSYESVVLNELKLHVSKKDLNEMLLDKSIVVRLVALHIIEEDRMELIPVSSFAVKHGDEINKQYR